MYILVNGDLKMSGGKAASQVGHVVQLLIEMMLPSEKWSLLYKRWKDNHIKKIVLRATEEQMLELMATYPDSVYIRDAGRTQVKPNSLTAMGFPPDPRYEAILSKFKLY